eukprot:5329107-Amphidinium_carterae.1
MHHVNLPAQRAQWSFIFAVRFAAVPIAATTSSGYDDGVVVRDFPCQCIRQGLHWGYGLRCMLLQSNAYLSILPLSGPGVDHIRYP